MSRAHPESGLVIQRRIGSMKLRSRTVLVTGGNSGIGKAIALRAAAEGGRIAICGRDPDKGAASLAELRATGAEAEFFRTDVAEEAEAKALVATVVARFGKLDVLVNNAGAGARRSGVQLSDTPGERWQKILGPNLAAAYYMGAYALPAIKAAGGGAIVNISSTATFHGNWGSYGVAKAGLEALTRSLAVEGAPHRIRANSVSPGWIKTDVTKNATASEDWEKDASLLGRMGEPDEIAKAVMFLASEDASFVTGATLIVDGGLTITDYPSLPFLDGVGAWKLFAGTLS
jgi:NAD(P)-dependent dehydrogenase (short-subunit alcohol dehydrogenase family)